MNVHRNQDALFSITQLVHLVANSASMLMHLLISLVTKNSGTMELDGVLQQALMLRETGCVTKSHKVPK